MDRTSIKQLRLDRRLTRRRGWIRAEELALELEKLPDVSHKMTTLGAAADQGEGASATPAGSARAEQGQTATEHTQPE